MKIIKITIGRIQLAEKNSAEKEEIHKGFPDLLKNNETMKDTEVKIHSYPGELNHPVKQKPQMIP